MTSCFYLHLLKVKSFSFFTTRCHFILPQLKIQWSVNLLFTFWLRRSLIISYPNRTIFFCPFTSPRNIGYLVWTLGALRKLTLFWEGLLCIFQDCGSSKKDRPLDLSKQMTSLSCQEHILRRWYFGLSKQLEQCQTRNPLKKGTFLYYSYYFKGKKIYFLTILIFSY